MLFPTCNAEKRNTWLVGPLEPPKPPTNCQAELLLVASAPRHFKASRVLLSKTTSKDSSAKTDRSMASSARPSGEVKPLRDGGNWKEPVTKKVDEI